MSMIDALDYMLLKGCGSADDENMSFHRVVGDLQSRVICFLPWGATISAAQRMHMIPARFLACYALPLAIVSSEPQLCADATRMLVLDALALIDQTDARSETIVILGLSLGSGPATVLANATGGRLCSVTSADRGDLMLWQSRAAVGVKKKAMHKGYLLPDFSQALQGLNSIENLHHIRQDSIFITSERDLFVPAVRSAALIQAVRDARPDAQFITSSRGHVRTLCAAVHHLPALLKNQDQTAAA